MDGGWEGRGVCGVGGVLRREWDGGIGTPADEENGNVTMATGGRVVEESEPTAALVVENCVSSVGKERVDDVEIPRVDCKVEGSPFRDVLFVDRRVRSVGEEGGDDVEMAIGGRVVERSLPSLVLLVD